MFRLDWLAHEHVCACVRVWLISCAFVTKEEQDMMGEEVADMEDFQEEDEVGTFSCVYVVPKLCE